MGKKLEEELVPSFCLHHLFFIFSCFLFKYETLQQKGHKMSGCDCFGSENQRKASEFLQYEKWKHIFWYHFVWQTMSNEDYSACAWAGSPRKINDFTSMTTVYVPLASKMKTNVRLFSFTKLKHRKHFRVKYMASRPEWKVCDIECWKGKKLNGGRTTDVKRLQGPCEGVSLFMQKNKIRKKITGEKEKS